MLEVIMGGEAQEDGKQQADVGEIFSKVTPGRHKPPEHRPDERGFGTNLHF